MNYTPFMSVFDVEPPIIEKKHLIKWLKTNYSFLRNKSFTLNKLNSERDINFTISIQNKKKYVLKISNPSENLNILEYQDRLIKHLSSTEDLKRNIPKIFHKKIVKYLDQKNRECFVRILSYLDGKMYGNVKTNSDIEKSLGQLLGKTSVQLQSFFDKDAYRKFIWDPSNIDWIYRDLNIFTGKKKLILLNCFFEYKKFVKNNLKNLRHSITHSVFEILQNSLVYQQKI